MNVKDNDNRVKRTAFEAARKYMREFYINGYMTRDELMENYGLSSGKLANYEGMFYNWMPGNMDFIKKGRKSVYTIDIDSREENHNPLYDAWKYSNTSGSRISTYFAMRRFFLENRSTASKSEIKTEINAVLPERDESSIGKDIESFLSQGIIKKINENGKSNKYKLADGFDVNKTILNFFSEAAECGVIGSFLIDRQKAECDYFSFKHHFLSGTLDSEVIVHLFVAMHEQREVKVSVSQKDGKDVDLTIVPLKIVDNIITGRKYVAAYLRDEKKFIFIRTDHIFMDYSKQKCMGKTVEEFEQLRNEFNKHSRYIWGTSARNIGAKPQRVEFIIRVEDSEMNFLPNKLRREKRIGNVTCIDDNHYKFSADVYDSGELIPWINSYLGRITEIYFEDKTVEEIFRRNLEKIMVEYGK